MSNPESIIDFARKCASGSTVRIKQVELGKALLLAVEALERIKNKGEDYPGASRDYGIASKALAAIRSLPAL